jgi:hypothetical protein
VRKKFTRNHYYATNIFDVSECDLIDIQNASNYNDGYRYLLSVIDVFSKSLHIVPLRVKTGTAVASAFRSILANYSHSRLVWVRTDRGKEFLTRPFQDMLKKEGIQFQVCRDPNVKCSVVEPRHRTMRDKLYKYMTYKNTYRYFDVLPKFINVYNGTINRTTGMAPSKVMDTDIFKIWRKMRAKHNSTRRAPVKFKVGQHFRISKEKIKF